MRANCGKVFLGMSVSYKKNRAGDRMREQDRPQRRWERHDVTIVVTVTTTVSGERSSFGGQASDISKGGLRLFLTRAIEPGTSLQMEFALPYDSTGLVIRGVVRNRTGFTHGIEFLHPTAYQQQMIERTCSVLALLG
jgi:hypothetical protein